jgi:O-acetyl-ADP-ribose deacetylase (regulator of RNase III)
MSLHKIEVLEADITTLKVDAVVNAANSMLLGGGGVDGAIHRAAGEGLYRECLGLQGCATGEAKITDGYSLAAKHVIHTVGPVWQGGKRQEAQLLASCYRNAMRLADEYRLRSLAFPSISTGIYRFPIEKACKIAFDAVLEALDKMTHIERLVFCTFSTGDFSIYQRELKSRKNLAGQN